MMPVSLHIQYCDSIIRHADDFRYSLIGIYPGSARYRRVILYWLN